MSIYKTAIGKPVTTALIFIAVIVIGLFSATRLPIDQFPEMDPPYITVMTTYAGASASEIETNVTKIIENSLTSVEGDDLFLEGQYVGGLARNGVGLQHGRGDQ